MLAVGGVILILSAFHVGVPGKVYVDGLTMGQALLILGTIPVTWALLNAFKRYVDHVPLLIGVAVIGYLGIYEREFMAVAGGAAIITIWAWNLRRSKKNRR